MKLTTLSATLPDTRIVELDQLAREEGFKLPYPADYIVWLESRGYVVDLEDGQIYADVSVKPTLIAKAVAYLLAEVNERELVI